MIRQIRVGTLLALFAPGLASVEAVPQAPPSPTTHKPAPAPAVCPVTLPRKGPKNAMDYFEPGTSRWKPVLHVGLWPDGTVVFQPGGPGSIEPNGSLAMKFWWTRGEGLLGN
jgi:hypothetical protein